MMSCVFRVSCCSVTQRGAACCSECCRRPLANQSMWMPACFMSLACLVLQCAAACCSVLQRVAVCCSVLQCAAACCSVGCRRPLATQSMRMPACLISPHLSPHYIFKILTTFLLLPLLYVYLFHFSLSLVSVPLSCLYLYKVCSSFSIKSPPPSLPHSYQYLYMSVSL